MKLKISAILLVLCLIFSSPVPRSQTAAFEQNLTGTAQTQLPEIETNPDDAAAMETVAAVIVVILIICVVIYICDSSN